jgi:polysaccharide deacetylase family protein (PEP-CTERM system associated)
MNKIIAVTFDIETVGLSVRESQDSALDREYYNLERELNHILELCDSTGIKATFFIVGQIAAENPGIVKLIASEGHEIASHSMTHTFFFQLSDIEIEKEIKESKHILEDVSGMEIVGFRVPAWTISEKNYRHFYNCLAEAGYEYSSSIYPGKTPLYGMPKADPSIHLADSGIMEFPMPVRSVCGFKIGFSGGMYFRFLPRRLLDSSIQKTINAKVPWFLYFHPYEFDVVDYSMLSSWKQRMLLMHNRKGLSQRIKDIILRENDNIDIMSNIIKELR